MNLQVAYFQGLQAKKSFEQNNKFRSIIKPGLFITTSVSVWWCINQTATLLPVTQTLARGARQDTSETKCDSLAEVSLSFSMLPIILFKLDIKAPLILNIT